MLEEYFVKPETVDRIRASWIGPEIERYVAWLAEQGYGARSVWRRVPMLVAFGEFARLRGARSLADLPGHVDAFVAERVGESRDARRGMGQTLAKEVRGPVEQMLELVVPGFEGTGRPHHARSLRRRGPGVLRLPGRRAWAAPRLGRLVTATTSTDSRPTSDGSASPGWRELSPAMLSAFVAERAGAGLAKTTVREGCGVLRVFLRYAHREGRRRRRPVRRPWGGRRSTGSRASPARSPGTTSTGCSPASTAGRACGKRDYAILLLLVTYGLRGREVAALTLDDIDWKRERLAIPERKAGHSTAFPLSAVGRRGARSTTSGTAGRRRPTATSSSARWRRVRPIGAAAVSSLRPALPAEGRDRGSPAGLAHAAPLGGPAPRRRRTST